MSVLAYLLQFYWLRVLQLSPITLETNISYDYIYYVGGETERMMRKPEINQSCTIFTSQWKSPQFDARDAETPFQ